MRVHAQRRAPQIAAFGWRPSPADLRDLRQSVKDARTFRTLAKAWRRAGFRTSAIMKFAGRAPANRNATIRVIQPCLSTFRLKIFADSASDT